MLLYRLLLFYKKFYNDLEEINIVKRYNFNDISISHTINDYIPLISDIELKGNHDYFILGYFSNNEGANEQTVTDFLTLGQNNVDYFGYIGLSPLGSLRSGTGAFTIYILKAINDIKVTFRMWNYVTDKDYTVNAQVGVIKLN